MLLVDMSSLVVFFFFNRCAGKSTSVRAKPEDPVICPVSYESSSTFYIFNLYYFLLRNSIMTV